MVEQWGRCLSAVGLLILIAAQTLRAEQQTAQTKLARQSVAGPSIDCRAHENVTEFTPIAVCFR